MAFKDLGCRVIGAWVEKRFRVCLKCMACFKASDGGQEGFLYSAASRPT